MCGIAGYIGREPPSDATIARACATMVRRGPDHQGSSRIALRDGTQAVLISSRLAIVDLDARSNMPFSRDGWSVAFNGELYNHAELRAELQRKEGVEFRTSSDTEVLVAGIARYGAVRFLDRAEGMWAFAAVNPARNEVVLSRDRFGEKPLFMWECTHGVYFASEIKTLAALAGHRFAVNEQRLLRYLVNGYRSLFKDTESWFADVHALPPRTVRTYSAEHTHAPLRHHDQEYWDPTPRPRAISEAAALEELRSLLPRAIGLRLRADVPIACCLSGGVDSSSIASLAVKVLGSTIHTFSIIDSNPHYDERSQIQAVVQDLGCQATFIEVPAQSFLERLSDLISYHDGPLATSSYYIHSYLSEAISAAGYRVALSGTGSDELFTGYYDHYLMHLAGLPEGAERTAALTAWSTHIQPVIRNPLLREWDRFIREPNFREHLYLKNPQLSAALRRPFQEPFREHDFHQPLLRNRMLNELFFEVVPPILQEDDLNSMRWSVENRSPFLDRALFEFCASLPSSYLISDGYQKSLLRKAMQGILTDTVRCARKKVGFNASITTLLDRADPAVRAELCEHNPLFELVEPAVMELLLEKAELTNQESQLLFSLINATLFLRQAQR